MDVNALFNTLMGNAGAGIDRAVETARSTNISSGLVGGVAAGGLAALLLSNKKARKMGKSALKYGGAAAIGGLAYKAWSNYKTTQQATQQATAQAGIPQAPKGSIFDLAECPTAVAGTDIRLSIISAMISAAKVDGHIDPVERGRIEEKIASLDLGKDEQTFLANQLQAESDPIKIARLSGSDEHAAELYLASAMAVDIDTPAERRYLDRLADALHLPVTLREGLDAEAARYTFVAS